MTDIGRFLDYGILGIFALALALAYKLVVLVINQKYSPLRDPGNNSRNALSYNEQAARVMYDVSKSLSEVAVLQKQVIETTKETMTALSAHSKEETSAWQAIIAEIKNIGVILKERQ